MKSQNNAPQLASNAIEYHKHVLQAASNAIEYRKYVLQAVSNAITSFDSYLLNGNQNHIVWPSNFLPFPSKSRNPREAAKTRKPGEKKQMDEILAVPLRSKHADNKKLMREAGDGKKRAAEAWSQTKTLERERKELRERAKERRESPGGESYKTE
ncbi:hypothetical protein ACLOJK_000189 [Asimina triloba]